MVVGENWLTECQECRWAKFWAVVPPVHHGAFLHAEKNKLYGYADDSTFVAVVSSHSERIDVAESLNRDLNMVVCGVTLGDRMKLKASKTKTMIVSRSGTIHHLSTELTLDGTGPKESVDLVILGATLDAKMTFEQRIRHVLELQLTGLVS